MKKYKKINQNYKNFEYFLKKQLKLKVINIIKKNSFKQQVLNIYIIIMYIID